ncbi:MAG: hypothetical protein F6K19_05135 [Cyanothece sp. SIO1E1]|nr:hypothetical protein [Cyanothece sp. SIO1E1]
MLSVRELRIETYWNWAFYLTSKGAYVDAPFGDEWESTQVEPHAYTNTAFKNEIRRQFGDLRLRSTWEAAGIYYLALNTIKSYCLEPYQVVGFMASADYMKSPIRQYYGDRVIDEILKFPEIIDTVKTGLEVIFTNNCYQKEQALVDEFLRSIGPRLPASALPVAI